MEQPRRDLPVRYLWLLCVEVSRDANSVADISDSPYHMSVVLRLQTVLSTQHIVKCGDHASHLRRCRLRRRESGLLASSRLSTAFISIMRLSCREQHRHSVDCHAADHATPSRCKRCDQRHVVTQAHFGSCSTDSSVGD